MLFRSGAPLQGALFPVFGANTPGPEFRGISRERGRRSLTCHAQGSDPPEGVAHIFTAKRESRPRQSGVPAPRLCLGGGGGLTFGRRAAATGGLAAHGGVVSAADGATFWRSGGARRAEAGAGGRKSRTRGGFRGPRGVRGCRGPGQNRGPPGLHPGARRAKNGQRRGKTGRLGGHKAGLAGAGAQKAPFFAPNGAGGGLCGRKTGGKSWRRV